LIVEHLKIEVMKTDKELVEEIKFKLPEWLTFVSMSKPHGTGGTYGWQNTKERTVTVRSKTGKKGTFQITSFVPKRINVFVETGKVLYDVMGNEDNELKQIEIKLNDAK